VFVARFFSAIDLLLKVIVVGAGIGFDMARTYEISVNWKFDRVAMFTDIQAALQALGVSSL
jgi:hypothetical protein